MCWCSGSSGERGPDLKVSFLFKRALFEHIGNQSATSFGWQVGDILVQGETGAQILVVPELIDHLEFNLTQV